MAFLRMMRLDMKKNRTLLAGCAISALLHAGLLSVINIRQQQAPAQDNRRTTVWLLPSTSALPPLSASDSVAPPAAAPAMRRALAPAGRARSPGASEPTAAAEQQPALAVLPAAPATEHAATETGASLPADPFAPAATPVPGKFDANAAMKSARKLATAKATRDDPAVAQLYDKPLYGPPADTPLGTAVGRTARADCKNAAAGARILALVILPVMILTDKKDSGCKW